MKIQEIQVLLQNVVNGQLPIDKYFEKVQNVPSQIQLKAALRQRRNWTADEYAAIRDEIRDEFEVEFQVAQPVPPPPPRVFNPLSVSAPVVIPEGMTPTVLPYTTSRKRNGGGVSKRNPTRSTSGRFRPGVAEVWYRHGVIKRRAFTGPDAIASAFSFASGAGEAIVKIRVGCLKGNRNIQYVSADGVAVPPQKVVNWHGQRADGDPPLAEKTTSSEDIVSLLKTNKKLRKVGCDLRNIDIPTESESEGIEYSVRFTSGLIRTYWRLTSSYGDVPGHKRCAYSLILDTLGQGVADLASTVKYTVDGKVYVVSRREAIEWAEGDEDDPILDAFFAAFKSGDLDADEYFERVSTYRYDLEQPGRSSAQERWSQEINWAKDEGIITEDAAVFMAKTAHPSYRDRQAGPTMWERKTRVQYGPDGHMIWQKCANDNSPGARWVGGQSAHEAMLYNL